MRFNASSKANFDIKFTNLKNQETEIFQCRSTPLTFFKVELRYGGVPLSEQLIEHFVKSVAALSYLLQILRRQLKVQVELDLIQFTILAGCVGIHILDAMYSL